MHRLKPISLPKFFFFFFFFFLYLPTKIVAFIPLLFTPELSNQPHWLYFFSFTLVFPYSVSACLSILLPGPRQILQDLRISKTNQYLWRPDDLSSCPSYLCLHLPLHCSSIYTCHSSTRVRHEGNNNYINRHNVIAMKSKDTKR